jgi:hypothetical protein
MIAWPGDSPDLSPAAGTALVPWKLTCQLGKVSHHTPESLIVEGTAGIGLGAVFLVTPLVCQVQPGNGLRWLCMAVGLLALTMGAVALLTGVQKWKRCIRARVARWTESLPAAAYQLGAPIALHQVRMFWRVAYVFSGSLLCSAAGICGAMILAGPVLDHGIAEVAFLGWPVGLYMIWQGMKLQAKRVLVFADGLVSFHRRRAVVCRWDQIEEVRIKLNEEGDVLQRFVLTLRCNNGEVLVFTPNTEYIQNQLVARVQYAHCACVLPAMLATLNRGGTLEFGPLQLGPDGIHGGQDVLGWSEIRAAVLDQTKLKILTDPWVESPFRTASDSGWEFNVDTVPNLTILLALVRVQQIAERKNVPARWS